MDLGTPSAVADGFGYGEGPRWHDRRLWFSDTFGDQVLSVGEQGDVVVEARIPRPSGLGWLPGGRLIVATLGDLGGGPARIFLRSATGFEVLREAAEGSPFNDLAVGPGCLVYFDFPRRRSPR